MGRQSAASVTRPPGEALRPVSQAAQRVADSVKTRIRDLQVFVEGSVFRLNSTVPL